jgi:IPT/TIG domain/FG-GAP repeat
VVSAIKVRTPRLVSILLAALCAALLVLPGGSLGAGARSAAAPELIARFNWIGGKYFGWSVALARSGKVAVVGDPDPNKGGTAWVFTHRSTLAEKWDKLALHGGDKSSGFGTTVAISGDGKVVLVGAPYDNRRKKGTAWIFRKANGGAWVGQKLRPNDESGNSTFGYGVALSADGSVALVGGFRDNKEKGAAWVFVRSGSTWKQRGKKLTGKGEAGRGRFGTTLALSGDGDLALIGAGRDNDTAGAAWFFAKSGSTWKQQGSKLTSGDKNAKYFGWDLALSANGKVALIGAPARFGDTFLFARTTSRWVRRQKLSYAGARVALSRSGNAAAISDERNDQADVFTCSSFACANHRALNIQQQPQQTQTPKGYGRDVAVADDRDVVLVASPAQVWVFVNSPLVESVVPGTGPKAGGTAVTITGENFVKVRGVSFGATPAASYTVDSSEQIHAVSPPGSPGVVHVRVTTSVGISPEIESGGWGSSSYDTFFYLDQPVVTSITPTSGPTAGGTTVTITGTNLAAGPIVRFGSVQAASPSVGTAPGKPDILTVTSPPHQAGTVDVTVTTSGGTSATSAADRFTYAGPVTEKLITFDDLSTGGPGGAGSLVVVNSQYAGQGVTFNNLSAIDYSKGGSALPGFAHSGTVAVESCVGVELCTNPIRATFSAPQKLVRVWVGFSFKLDAPLQVRLTAYAGASVAGTASATLPANPSVTNITTPLAVQVASATITKVEVSVPGGYNNALAVDDVTFQS